MLRFVYITCISVNTGHSLNLYACVDDVIMTSGECSDSTSVFFFFYINCSFMFINFIHCIKILEFNLNIFK